MTVSGIAGKFAQTGAGEGCDILAQGPFISTLFMSFCGRLSTESGLRDRHFHIRLQEKDSFLDNLCLMIYLSFKCKDGIR